MLNEKESKMKKAVPIIIILLIFTIGLGILTYPLISSVANNIEMRSHAAAYFDDAKKEDPEDIKAMFAEAEEYNQSLLNTVILTDPFDEESYAKIGAHYMETFNTNDDGLIGYIDVPKINVFLPIYHGTSTEILTKGAGHLENTALPIGGPSTHSVISAHSAFPTETFFDYLVEMEEGDEFYIHVLNRTLKYQVDQIKVILPTETQDLHVIEGKDYVTLLTCTPYTINTHRLLVRGERVEYEPDEGEDMPSGVTMNAGNDGMFFFGYKLSYLTIGIILGSFVLLIVIIVLIIVSRRKKGKHVASKEQSAELDKGEV